MENSLPAVVRPRNKALNDRTLKALKPARKGTYDVRDAVVPGFGVRVAATGRKTFVLTARFPGSPHPTRRALGVYGVITLDQARANARGWLELIRKGTDPRIEEQRQRDNSFRMVAEAYFQQAVIGPDPAKPKQRKAAEVKRTIEKEFVSRWGGRPIVEITADDVAAVIESIVARGSPGQARNVLSFAKMLFGWAARQRRFGLKRSPCESLKGKHLIGPKAVSDRILSDIETAAFWRNVGRFGYPYAPLYQLLLLTGLRLNEVADASWPEFDLKDRLWTIPASRMKGTNDKARPHVVPLNDDMVAVLERLPRFKGGDFLFTNNGGRTSIYVRDEWKKKLDARMLRTLRAWARMQGDDPKKVTLAPWVNHDLRRTLRSGLSRLRIDHDVKEAILAHAKTGIAGVYDRYDLLDEKRQALELWAARLRSIVQPAPANVIKLARA